MVQTYYFQCSCGYTTDEQPKWREHKPLNCKIVKFGRHGDQGDIIIALQTKLAAAERHVSQREEQLDQQMEMLKSFVSFYRKGQFDMIDDMLTRGLSSNTLCCTSGMYRSEPQRRRIAQRQNWRCAGTDCPLQGDVLRGYSIVYTTPLCLGGCDVTENMQAMCYTCMKDKLEHDKVTCLARVPGESNDTPVSDNEACCTHKRKRQGAGSCEVST